MELLQEAEPAPRIVPLNLLLKLHVQLSSLTARCCALKFVGLLLAPIKLFWINWFRINLGDKTESRRYYFKSLR